MASASRDGSQLPAVRPSMLDRAILSVAPQFGLRRLEARVRYEAALRFFGPGGYQGARADRPALKNWNPRIDSGDSASIPDLQNLRARSADLERNDPIAAGAMSTAATHTVGLGIVPHARVNREYLGITDEAAEAWERRADFIWSLAAESTTLDLEGKFDFYFRQELGIRAILGRGDMLVIRRFVERPGELLGLKLQYVEADRICNADNVVNTDRLIDGVHFDENGMATAFDVLDTHPGNNLGLPIPVGPWTTVDAFGADSQSRRALLVYRPTRLGQTRGVPWFAPIVEMLKQISRYSEAEIMAAVISSFFTVFVKTTNGDTGLTDMGDPNTLEASRAPLGAQNDVRMGPAAVVGLNPGEEIELADPKRPNAAFDPFMTSVLSMVGVALEIPRELLMKSFMASYSASRAAMLEGWRAVRTRRDWYVRSYCAPVREWVLEEAIARGLLSAPGFFDDPLVRAAYLGCKWVGPTMGQLDPESEVNAAQKRVDGGFSTIEDETTELNGGDFEENHRQRVKEHRLRVDAGLEGEVAGAMVRETVQTTTPSPQPAPPSRAARDRLNSLAS